MAAILKLPRDEAAMQPLIEKVASFCPLKVPVRLVLQHFLSNLGSSQAANTAGKLTSVGVSLSVWRSDRWIGLHWISPVGGCSSKIVVPVGKNLGTDWSQGNGWRTPTSSKRVLVSRKVLGERSFGQTLLGELEKSLGSRWTNLFRPVAPFAERSLGHLVKGYLDTSGKGLTMPSTNSSDKYRRN